MKFKDLYQRILALFLVCSSISAFAQDKPEKAEPNKLAVYTYGASEAGINKVLGIKLLSAITRSGKYAEIWDSEAFYKKLAKSNEESLGPITQTAKQYGADFVCAVSITEAFGDYSISARIIKTADSQVVKTAVLGRSMKSLDDLTKVSNELTVQLLQLQQPQALLPAATSPNVPVAVPVAQKKCAKTFSINEIILKVEKGFPKHLKDCSAELAISMAPVPAFLKKASGPKKPPKEFMMQCTVDGIKKDFPEGLDANKYVGNIEKFLQNIMNAASAANGELDVVKLTKAVGGINISELLNSIRKLADEDECVN
jgi:uncharacterized protein YbjQ (UPF0145 family)